MNPGPISRTHIINFLINLWGYSRYLEIGVQYPDWNYNHIQVDHKEGVDPAVPCTHQMTSDEYFSNLNPDVKFDLIFVDGLHVEDQFYRDVLNALDHLAEGGRIVCHDCNPATEEWEDTGKNGTTWRGWVKLRQERPDLTMMVIDSDYGCGVIRRGGQMVYPMIKELQYKHLEDDRASLLPLVPWLYFKYQENLLNTLLASK